MDAYNPIIVHQYGPYCKVYTSTPIKKYIVEF